MTGEHNTGVYVKENYKSCELREIIGGSRTLSEFLDVVIEDAGPSKSMEWEDVGRQIHEEIIKSVH